MSSRVQETEISSRKCKKKIPKSRTITYYKEPTCSKDFVLVWEEELGAEGTKSPAASGWCCFAQPPDEDDDKEEKRRRFEENLEMDGLWLTREPVGAPCPVKMKVGSNPLRASYERVRKLLKKWMNKPEPEFMVLRHFVHIHVPRDVLCEYISIMKLRMPIRESMLAKINLKKKRNVDFIRSLRNLFNRFFNFIDEDLLRKEKQGAKHAMTAEFSKEKEAILFDVLSEDFYSETVRIMVANFILERTSYSDDQCSDNQDETREERGIQRLLADNTYVAAYPLHDSDRQTELLDDWASVRKWFMYQPIDAVNEYLGVKNGLYFAWLGYYTYMLLPAAVVGVACFLYGVATLGSDNISRDVCELGENITMCPTCDKNCDYENLSEMCGYAKATYLFDNRASIFFAVFMSIWSTVYIDMWKRYSAGILHRWGLTGFDNRAELSRPEYLASLTKIEGDKKRTEKDQLTGRSVQYVSFWKVRVPFTVFSFSVVLALVVVVAIAVFGVLVYEMIISTLNLFGRHANTSTFLPIFQQVTSAGIQLICIKLLSKVYNPLAVKLTDMEYLRTQSQYDNSLTVKSYLFEFVNTYSSIFYIVFLKGKFPGYPAKYNRIFGLRQDECSGSGCLLEISIQVSIILVGDQTMRLVWFAMKLAVAKWKKQRRRPAKGPEREDEQWVKDFKLKQWGATGLFDDYLEMVVQYGLVTIFVAAFPLAPLFALINNVFELRLDAKKFLLVYRRSVPSRVKNIGVWLYIMEVLGRVATITNAFIIAFSSSFIPELVYKMAVAKGGPYGQEDVGFLNFTLAYFNTSDFRPESLPINPSANVTICRYPEFRNPPDHQHKYRRPLIYWHILVGRLVFIVLFQNIVSIISMAIQYMIPNTPASLREQVRAEAHLVNDAIIKELRQKRRATKFAGNVAV